MLGVRWRVHLALTATTAVLVVFLDLGSKWAATAGSASDVRFDYRPPAQLLPFVAVALALLAATSLAGSRPLDLAAGLLAGGALGNIASTAVWRRGIPDFIPAHGFLLNAADVSIAVGLVALVGVALVPARREVGAGR
jgi:lipoprotein signal peptidase